MTRVSADLSRRLPPYAGRLAGARRRGLVPALPVGFFFVALGWQAYRVIRDIEEYPAIVLPLDCPLADYDLRPLAGLNVAVLYEPDDLAWVEEALDALAPIRLGQVLTISTHTLLGESNGVDSRDGVVYREWTGR
jgi:hypothetical protein